MDSLSAQPAGADRLIDPQRLWSTIMEIARIGAIPGGGSCRLSLSDEDRQARDLFASWCLEAGCDVRVDPYGNMFAVRAGKGAGQPSILIGSHLDTQPHGGRFDGVLGVLAGLEIVRTLNDRGIVTERPVVVVNWTNEEGVRFKPGLTGSAGFAGYLDPAAVTGSDGEDFFAELRRTGYAGTAREGFDVLAYYELHIEQGPVLERADAAVGVVEGIQGVRWYKVSLAGRDAHAGTTPMDSRKDSFMAAAAIAFDLRATALKHDPDLRFTVGKVTVEPNSVNTVPGHAELLIDLRHRDDCVLDRFEDIIAAAVKRGAAQEGVDCAFTRTMTVPPVTFDPAMQERLVEAALQVGVVPERLPSGAMHDASNMARIAPTAMVFVQSRDGISHNPAEWSSPAHVATACEVLARAVLSHACES